MTNVKTEPMKSGPIAPFINRTYDEGGDFQWVRETIVNATEAGASNIWFEIEPQGLEIDGTKRLVIVDDGCGMTPDEMRDYLNTFGSGSKTIGGAHDNFGFGAKTSLLPWNSHGLVVVSRRDGLDAMVWMHCDSKTGVYGLRTFRSERNELESVVAPFYDDEMSIDWSRCLPERVGASGTAFVLLGSHVKQETVYGDPSRSSIGQKVKSGEAAERGILRYVNGRFFSPTINIAVKNARTGDLDSCKGLSASLDRLAAHKGVLPMPDGSELAWFLSEKGASDNASAGKTLGKISVKYRNELYGQQTGYAPFRTFGINSTEVRNRLAIVITPPELNEASPGGVRPDASRGSLGQANGRGLPFVEWGAAFYDAMPSQIREALNEAVRENVKKPERRRAVAERLSVFFKGIDRPVKNRDGLTNNVCSDDGAAFSRDHYGRTDGGTRISSSDDPKPRKGVKRPGKKQGAAGMPDYQFVSAEDLEPEMIAAVDFNADPPMVSVNEDHRFIAESIEYLSNKYSDLEGKVTDGVKNGFGLHLTQVVAGVLAMKQFVPRDQVENLMLSPAALTAAVAGCVCEDSITRTLGQKTMKLGSQHIVLQAEETNLSHAVNSNGAAA